MTRSNQSERGFTLVEVVIVLLLTSTIVFTMFQLAKSSTDANRHVVAQGRATEVAQSILHRMRSDLLHSVRVFENDTVGMAYDGMLADLAGAEPIVDILPTATFDTAFGVEATSATRSGNSLLLARHDRTDEFVCSSGQNYHIDLLRMVRYHLVSVGKGPRPGVAIGLNLARWVSEPIVDGSQVDDIRDDIDRAEVLMHLRNGTADQHGQTHPQVQVAWLVGSDPSLPATLRYIGTDGSLDENPQGSRSSTWDLVPDEGRSSKGLLFYRHFSVATNYATEGLGVGRYSQSHNVGDGFPHGFEVQIIGPSKSRQVLLQLCVVSTRRQGLPAWANLRSIAQVRDL